GESLSSGCGARAAFQKRLKDLLRLTRCTCPATGALLRKPGAESAAPMKKRWRSEMATNRRSGRHLRFLKDSEPDPQPKSCVGLWARRACAASRAVQDRVQKKPPRDSQTGRWKCLP